MKTLTRNFIAWLQEFLPMWQMKMQILYKGEIKQFEASEGIDWWLPRLKKNISHWNESAGNPNGDPEKDHAYYVRLK